MVDEEERPQFKRALSLIAEERTNEVALDSNKDFEGETTDPQDLRMKVTDEAVLEVVAAVERQAA